MSTQRHAAAAVLAVVALVALKGMRHADEARLATGPAVRAVAHEIEDGHASDAFTIAEITAEAQEAPGDN